ADNEACHSSAESVQFCRRSTIRFEACAHACERSGKKSRTRTSEHTVPDTPGQLEGDPAVANSLRYQLSSTDIRRAQNSVRRLLDGSSPSKCCKRRRTKL